MATRRKRLVALESTLAPKNDEDARDRPVVLDPKLGPRFLETIRHFMECGDEPIDWPAERERILADARAIWERRRAERAAEPRPLDG
jgi:hypothetical protein